MSVVLTHPEIALQKPHWLAGVDSNLQMSFWKMPFEMSSGFRLIPKHLGTRDFSRTSCQNTDMHLRVDWLIGCVGDRIRTDLCLEFSDVQRRSSEKLMVLRTADRSDMDACE